MPTALPTRFKPKPVPNQQVNYATVQTNQIASSLVCGDTTVAHRGVWASRYLPDHLVKLYPNYSCKTTLFYPGTHHTPYLVLTTPTAGMTDDHAYALFFHTVGLMKSFPLALQYATPAFISAKGNKEARCIYHFHSVMPLEQLEALGYTNFKNLMYHQQQEFQNRYGLSFPSFNLFCAIIIKVNKGKLGQLLSYPEMVYTGPTIGPLYRNGQQGMNWLVLDIPNIPMEYTDRGDIED